MSSDTAAASAPLREWIAARGALVEVAGDKIDPVGADERFGGEDRSIFARQSVQASEILVTLRRGAYLSGSSWLARVSEEAGASDGKELEKAVNSAQLSATALTALALLYERAAGSTSDFAEYVAQLPTDISLPLAWSKDQQQLLKHTVAFPLIDAELVEKVYSSYIEPLAAKFPAVWSKDQVSMSAFRWAYSIVSSRAFTIGDGHEPTLLPVIDMANHDADDPAARIEKTEAGEFQLVATRDIAEGDAVTISYGDLSNAQLLCRYGFVLPSPAPSDSILITSGELSSTYRAYLHSAAAANDDDDYGGDDADEAVAATGGSGEKKAAKRRKVFDTREESDGDALFFLLHGDQTREFGLGDALLSYVLATKLPAEELYEVLTIILRKKDKQYSDALASWSAKIGGDGDDDAEAKRLAALLSQHERQVCRRILLGLITLEEESSSEDDDEIEDGADDGSKLEDE